MLARAVDDREFSDEVLAAARVDLLSRYGSAARR